MTLQNLPTFDDITKMGLSSIVELPASVLEDFLIEADARSEPIQALMQPINAARALINAAIAEKFRDPAQKAYAAKGENSGIVNLETGEPGLTVVVDTPKRPEWDQVQLAAIETRLVNEWMADPSEYITTKRTVAEAKFKSWPTPIKAMFEPARTLKVGTISFKLKRKAEES